MFALCIFSAFHFMCHNDRLEGGYSASYVNFTTSCIQLHLYYQPQNIVPLPKVRTFTCKQLNGFPTARIISWAPFFLKVSILSAQDLSKQRIHNLEHGSTSVDYLYRSRIHIGRLTTSEDPQPQLRPCSRSTHQYNITNQILLSRGFNVLSRIYNSHHTFYNMIIY